MNEALAKIEQTQGIQALKAPENMQQFSEMLGNRAPHFISSIMGLFASNQKLLECQPESIVMAAIQGAAMDLSFDPNLGEAYMVPYNKKQGNQWVKVAQYQPGYKGLIQLALRTGQYKKLGAQVVTRQAFNALRQRVESSPEDPAGVTIKFFEMLDFYPEFQDGRVYGYIAYFELINGFKKFVFWTSDRCLEHAKKYSKQQDKQGNLYGSWVDSVNAMSLKTVIRQLFKYGPKSKEMRTSLEFDSQDLSSDYDRFEVNTEAPKRLGHEDEDLFGADPQEQKHISTPQLEKAYTAVEEKLEELDYHPKHLIASLSKHLSVDDLRSCQDINKLRIYYKHLDNKLNKLKEEQNFEDEADPKMSETITEPLTMSAEEISEGWQLISTKNGPLSPQAKQYQEAKAAKNYNMMLDLITEVKQ
jgi:recombination protein RecT